MSRWNWRILAGGGLILMGVIALLDAVFQVELSGLLWSFLFLLGGAAFLAVLANDRNQWWAAIPGFTLLGIGALIGLSRLAPAATDQIGGAIVLGGIGLSFIVVYILNRNFWWAIIPAGVMASLVVMLVLEPVFGESIAWIFLLGLAATFGLVYLLPTPGGERMEWALWPAGVMVVISLIVMGVSVEWAAYAIPALMILAGIVLFVRALRRG
ncbi:hypothetical protein BECAL_03304 [Bellilinea caldifistulae]|uniref:DUF5668 domain-containing protein n=1 Tax=Bellilinea caldifistulae TaxID=360411 RepID=A0A0P6XKB3_9CHLR|nr:hypothetical protein [Bellilinea caldifistulae]KPL76404.1 hypothetical protein AC812_07070 [Bellilinea caldifistulae]GAP12102.1 hypothetical protein BECAL_03304 [Bellilinea caldifistulae]